MKTAINSNRVTWFLDSKSCGIRINNVRKTDGGIYKCYVFQENNGVSQTKGKKINIKVAFPAKVYAEQDILTISSRKQYSSENKIDLKCRETSGYPKPEVLASVGPYDVQNISKIDLLQLNSTIKNGKTTHYDLNITPKLCNYHFKCDIVQKFEGNEFYDSAILPDRLCNVFTFSKSDKIVTVKIPFNTSSNDYQVQWIIRSWTKDNIKVIPGHTSNDEAIVANMINNTKTEKYGVLVIKNTSLVDLNSLHYLNVNSGGVSKQYGFFLVQNQSDFDQGDFDKSIYNHVNCRLIFIE